MTSVPNYRHSVAPATLNHRYLSEDVHCTLIPLRELAQKAEVATPTLDGIIHFTSLIAAPSKGETKTRSLDALGWSSLSQAAIMERVTA
jgi:opine dehydrogenase